MTTITDFPAIRPSFLLDFANSGRVDPRISCVRAGTATFCGPDGKRRTVASNVPRIDYDPVTGKCLGLLVEEARTNFILNSGDLSQAAWVKSRATAAAPDADGFCKVVEDGSSNSHYVSQAVTLSAADRVVRLLVKAGERTKAQIEFTGNTGNAGRRVVVDLVAGTVLSNSLIGSGGLTSSSVSARLIGAGVTELTIQVTPTATTGATANLLIILHDGSSVTYQGDGVSGIYAKEVQVEAGVFPTSYIPTDAASVTRAADAPSLSGSIPGFNPERGTLIVSYDYPTDNVANMIPLSLDAGSQANSIALATSGSSTDRFLVQAGGVGVFNSGFAPFVAGTRKTSGIAFGAGRISTSSEGRAAVTVAGVALPVGLNRITLGHSGYFGASRTSGHIARLAYYPVPVTDSQLQRLTA